MSAIAPFDRMVKRYFDLYGFEVNIVKYETSSEYDVDSSSFPVNERLVPARGMLFDYILKKDGTGKYGNTLIQEGNKQLYILPPVKNTQYAGDPLETIDPTSDKIKIKNDLYEIVTFKEVNPSTTDSCLWELYICK